MTTNEKIAALRAAVRDVGAQGVILQCSDPHSGEYLPEHYNSITFFSGFHGENCTLLVTLEGSALWCDGRFYGQADRELEGSEIVSMHAGCAGVPTVKEYIGKHFHERDVLLVDGFCITTATARNLIGYLSTVKASLCHKDMVLPLWTALDTRPALPETPAYLLSEDQTGESVSKRLARIREALSKVDAEGMPLTLLDDIGWAFCLRADDLPNTPLAVAFAYIDGESARLYLDSSRLTENDRAKLQAAGVVFRPYASFNDDMAALSGVKVLITPAKTNFGLYTSLADNETVTVIEGRDPIQLMKGVKNETELKNLRACHVLDGLAVCRFEMDLEAALQSGDDLREFDIDGMLKRRREEMPGYFEDSFPTIAAWGPNAAMMHYQAKADKDSVIERHGFLLVDNGGQYDMGTTDITRTYPTGPLTEEERLYYTWTLMGHIDMARAVFLDDCAGSMLDTFARAPLWAHKINYRCGTGHGVGFISSVHEGPQNLGPRGTTIFKPGMTVTDEPGVYEDGKLGIRIENELECISLETNAYGHWLGFRPLTLVPIDVTPLVLDEMSRAQIDWLNGYHKMVYTVLSPLMTDNEKTWLAKKTQPVAR